MHHASTDRAFIRLARRFARRARSTTAPGVYAFTDPERTPDVMALLPLLPRGAAVVYRSFGAPDASIVAKALRRETRRRGLVFLVGADVRLARRVCADGVHLPERLAGAARRARPTGFIVTCAAHSEQAVRRARLSGVDAIVMSTVFASRSASAGRAMGALRLAGIIRRTQANVVALGGVNPETARSLWRTGAVGFAAVEAFPAGQPRTGTPSPT